jgi:hypothetical protein
VTGKPETAIFCELCDINSFILWAPQQKQLHSARSTTERASFSELHDRASYCEPFNRNSTILWAALQKQLHSVIHTTGTASLCECMTETASFCELNRNSFILWSALQKTASFCEMHDRITGQILLISNCPS